MMMYVHVHEHKNHHHSALDTPYIIIPLVHHQATLRDNLIKPHDFVINQSLKNVRNHVCKGAHVGLGEAAISPQQRPHC
jgi:hypothetical protein